MNSWTFIMGLIAVMILLFGILAVVQKRKLAEIRKNNPGFPKGHWMNQGIGIGMAIGAGIGVAMGNIAIGIAIGVAIGTAIGSGLEKQHQDEVRPLTDEEEKIRKQSLLFAISTLLLGLIVFVVTYFIAQ